MNIQSTFKASLLGASALILMTAAQAQRPSPGGTLERARHLFSQIDTNKDGVLSAAEAGRTKIPTRDFVSSDTNRDRKLSSDEFLIFYRKLLVKGNKTVGKSLDAEVARIQAAYRTSKKDATGGVRNAAKGVEAKPAGTEKSADGLTAAQRAQQARDAATKQRIENARAQKTSENNARAQEVRDSLGNGSSQSEADRIAAARKQLADQEAQRIANARAQKQADDLARAQAARQQLAEADAARKAAARDHETQTEKDRATEAHRREVEHNKDFEQHNQHQGKGAEKLGPFERAQAYVKRLTHAGRLTHEQAKDIQFVLNSKASSAKGSTKATHVRESLRRAKARVGDAVRAGHLSAQEGRELSTILDERAHRAIGAQEHTGNKGGPEHGQGQHPVAGPEKGDKGAKPHPVKGPGEARGTLGAGKRTKPKDAGVRTVGGKGKDRGKRDGS